MSSRHTLSGAVLAIFNIFAGFASVQAQSWTVLTHQPSVGVRLCLLLTDATVICQSAHDWYKLTPDLAGSYVNGTWSQIASFPAGYEPYVYSPAVLADGRVVVVGGEYDASGNIVLSNKAAVYDPTANTWTPLAPPSGWDYIGDAPATMLANGQFLIGSKLDTRIALLDPATLTWTVINPTGKGDFFNSEENWMLLPDGSVFTLDVKNSFGSERYIPSTSTWVSAGLTPQAMSSPPGEGPITIAPGVVYTPPGDMGPAMLLPNGKVFAVGGTGHTAIFTPPPANSTAPGTWVQGPELGLWVDDGPAAMLPNGHMLIVASPSNDRLGLTFFEFDGTNLVSVPTSPNASADASNFTNLLLLPTGQVLLVDTSTSVQIYTAAGTYNPSWAPTISSVPATLANGSSYQISGTQFNGLSQGIAFGDENQNATNYPLVRITNNASGHVFYARTHGHSSMGVATGSTPVSTNFDVPVNTELGASTLAVVANGIPSAPIAVSITSTTPPPITVGCPASTGIVAIPYSSAFLASGGQPPFNFSILTGSLPSNLLLTVGTGAIAGTPNITGLSSFTVRVADSASGFVTANCSINVTPPPVVSFQGKDSTTQGNWKGVYGGDGYLIANDSSNPPVYGTVGVTGASTWTWVQSTTDSRGLLKGASTTDRIASTFYSGANFTFDVNLTGGQHQVALYLLDFDSSGRSQSVSIIDANTNALLDTQAFANYHSGVYAVWNLQGHVLIKVTYAGGQNAVVSGLFFGSSGGSAPPAAPVVAITAPSAGSVSGTVTVTANATAAGVMASVQFQLDGTNLGAPVTGAGPPFSTSWNTTASSNGSHTLTAIATDQLGQHATSAGVTVSVANGGSGSPSASFLTGYALNSPPLRNDFSGWVGMKLTVGANPLTIATLGRICVANNALTHTVKLVNAGNGTDVPGATASINMAGCTAGQFVYGAVGSITLPAGGSYYLVSLETQGGDHWYDQGSVSATNVAVVNNSVYAYNGVWYSINSTNTSYVPPNFQYTVVAPVTIAVTVQASPVGPSFSVDGASSTTSQALTWNSGSSHTIATTSPQNAGAGTQNVWSGWSDGGAISHTVAPASGVTYTASFTTQYLLTGSVSPTGGGSAVGAIAASPSSAGGYYNSGASVQLTATPASGCTFVNWTGALTGTANPQSVTMSAPRTVTANFQCAAPPPLPACTAPVMSLAQQQVAKTMTYVSASQFPEVTNPSNSNHWNVGPATDWTSGFYPGLLWYMYEQTLDNSFLTRAKAQTASMIGETTDASGHDVGFRILSSYGNGYRITRDPSYMTAIQTAAGTLASLYQPGAGVINSWPYYNNTKTTVIIDNMMNLELLFYAAQNGGDPNWNAMAVSHALKTIQNNVRPDGSTYQGVEYNADGSVYTKFTEDGASTGSTWSRGQAWGLYGFTMTYRYTQDARFLTTAQQLADYFIQNLPADFVPYWDFSQSAPAPRDSSAAAIAAAGLLELSTYVPEPGKSTYYNAALNIQASLASAAYLGNAANTDGILLHGTYNKPFNLDVDTSLIWGDYYFIQGCYRAMSKPPAPANLVATSPVPGQVNLTWDAQAGAIRYSVKRSATPGGPYVTLAPLAPLPILTTNSFADTAVAPATTYYYVVSAINVAGESANSPEALATSLPGQLLLTTNVSPAASGTIAANPSSGAGNYNIGTPVQLTATPASGCTFVNWTGALSGTTNPQTVTMSAPRTVTANFQCSGTSSTNFVTSYTNGPLRNDFTGWVGMKITVSANPLAISALGRICVANNALSHIVKLVNPSNGTDVPGASVSVNMAGCTAGQFVYGALSSITLPAGTSYYLVTQETQGGDRWYEQGAITTTNAAVANSSVYFYNGTWYPIGVGNTSYVPPNLQYSIGTVTQYVLSTSVSPAASGSIGANPASAGGSYTSGTAVQLTATPASGCTFLNWAGALTGSANPQTVTMSGPQAVTANFQCSGSASTSFVTANSTNRPLRNDFSGWVGMKLTVGANPLPISTLGRICVANNSLTHTVKLVNASNGSDVPGASVSVNMAGCTAGQFVYSAVSSITLTAGASYYLVSQETQNGDRWYDQGAISVTNVATVNSSVYFYNGTWYPINSTNTSYVPPSFQY